jgi:twitching motility protein PilT
MILRELLESTVARRGSDLHLLVGLPPTIRVDGELLFLTDELLTAKAIEEMVFSVTSTEQREMILTNRDLDFSLAFGTAVRLRANAYFQKGSLAAEFRLIPLAIRTIEELNLPEICHEFAQLRQGFILVTGPTGHGKSTTLAAILNEINYNRACHLVTIEDPIEFIFPTKKAIVSQREIHTDSHSWEIALRSALREDSDVVLVGEMRDLETISSALTIAETGHLVFSTLHTNSAAQTIDRIIDVFPEHSKSQVRMQLAASLKGVFSQRLVPALPSGRIPAVEVMLASPAIQTAIREGKTHMIDNIIQTSGELGMVTLEAYLASLVKRGKVSLETAEEFCLRPEELMRQVRRK